MVHTQRYREDGEAATAAGQRVLKNCACTAPMHNRRQEGCTTHECMLASWSGCCPGGCPHRGRGSVAIPHGCRADGESMAGCSLCRGRERYYSSWLQSRRGEHGWLQPDGPPRTPRRTTRTLTHHVLLLIRSIPSKVIWERATSALQISKPPSPSLSQPINFRQQPTSGSAADSGSLRLPYAPIPKTPLCNRPLRVLAVRTPAAPLRSPPPAAGRVLRCRGLGPPAWLLVRLPGRPPSRGSARLTGAQCAARELAGWPQRTSSSRKTRQQRRLEPHPRAAFAAAKASPPAAAPRTSAHPLSRLRTPRRRAARSDVTRRRRPGRADAERV
eukprot:363187-Chlamydomonas_euryale.AAC.3